MSEPAGPTGRSGYFTVTSPAGQITRCEITSLPFLMGRQPDCQLVLRDTRISRQHASLTPSETGLVLVDLGSRHGTWVNQARLEGPHDLQPGDTITFGFDDSYQLEFGRDDGRRSTLENGLAAESNAAASLSKLRSLLEVARAVQSSLSVDEVLISVVDASLRVTGAERGFLLLKSGVGLDVRVARENSGASLSRDELRVPTAIIDRALSERRDLLTLQFMPEDIAALEPDATVAALQLRSVLCVPLIRVRTETSQDTLAVGISDTIGALYLDSKNPGTDLSEGNRELLETLAIEASTILENARLLEEERARQRLERELEIAREIQLSLLPRIVPQSGWLRAAGSCVATHLVGGDFFDMVESRPGCWSVTVADVSGKGISSALLASFLQGAFQQAPEPAPDILAMLGRVNQYLYERTEGEKYATIFHAVLQRESRGEARLRWTNAGHCAPILLRASGEIETLAPTSMPVGMLDFTEFEVREMKLGHGDRLAIFSDGLTEAQGANGVEFDGELKRILGESRGLSAREIHDRVRGALKVFSAGKLQADDQTLLLLEICAD
jgi:serine phosphatase RsbU (regulator of sigma subunit)